VSGFDNYDAWKTASPHDDEIDVEKEIDAMIKRLKAKLTLGDAIYPREIIKFLEDLKEWIPEQ